MAVAWAPVTRDEAGAVAVLGRLGFTVEHRPRPAGGR